MSEEVNAILTRLPADRRINLAVCEALDGRVQRNYDRDEAQAETRSAPWEGPPPTRAVHSPEARPP